MRVLMETSVLLSVSVFTVTCILFFHGNTEATGDVAINFGSKWNSTALDGREWTGESASVSISGQSTSSVVVTTSFLGADPVPYMTSRVSSSPFHFTFHLSPGQKFIRLHFYPALYRGFENSLDLFSVKAGPFLLLNDFSPTHASGSQHIVREFCLNVEQHGKMRITFSPLESHMAYAFVNGIEIVSMPTGLYYTPDGDIGASLVGQNSRFYAIDNRTALEMVQRLNIGGSFISSVEDFGMFRRWNADTGFFLGSGESIVNYRAPQLAAYTNLPGPLLIAPPRIFQTSWKSTAKHQLKSFTWKIPITLGFRYLVRLHFCDLDAAMTGGEQEEFSILIDNQIAEMRADFRRWSGGTGFPLYKDYVVTIKGDKEGSECDLIIVLPSVNGLSLEFLKGMEIFRLSNLQNSLATSTSNHAVLKKVSTNWNLKVGRSLFSLFSQSTVIGTGMLVIILIVNTAVYCLRIISEENSQNNVNDAAVEPSNRRFSLADIRSATLNFSDAFVIGRGGFGNVYKGLIYGYPEIVAIKRLSSFSRQGAREFWAEIDTLSKLRHFNLVSLIGYCDEDEEMILVYEYISGGTLAENLYKFARNGKECTILSWEHRLRICIGAARGLEYLHTGSETGIIHRDVKDSNILLDDKFVAKISDFGLSKLEEPSQSESLISTLIKGTPGYVDPHYCSTRRLTTKSDVYSFGIVMLVVLSGKPALDRTNPGEPNLLACFQECLSREDFDRIVDANICSSILPRSLKEFATCVKSCLQQNPQNRPTMAQLVAILQQALQLQQKPIIEAQPVEHFELEIVHQTGEMSHGPEAIQTGETSHGPVAIQSGETSHGPLAIQTGEMSHGPVVIQTIQTDETSHGPVATLDENAVSALREEITRNRVTNRIRKPFRIWPWKIGSSRGEILNLGDLPLYSYETVANATDNFRNQIGQGSFGPVYKGKLLNGQEIAVRRLGRTSNQGVKEFMNEVTVLSKLQHRNIVRLLGGCVEREEKMLLYEYMPNKSLDVYLFDSHVQDLLDWDRRLIIIKGISRGLLYLHRDSRVRIIHRDPRSSNILLDEDLNPKISDVGLARIIGNSQDEFSTTRTVGTMGYIAPEYAIEGKCSEKSDVYTFGIVLLEVVFGKRNCRHYDGEGIVLLPRYAWTAWMMWDERHAVNVAFTEILDLSVGLEIKRCIQIGLLCVQDSPNDRPNMSDVLLMLNSEIVDIPLPKPVYIPEQSYDTNNDSPEFSPYYTNSGLVTLSDSDDIAR